MKEQDKPLEGHVFDTSEYVKIPGTRRLGPDEISVPMDVVMGLVDVCKMLKAEDDLQLEIRYELEKFEQWQKGRG